MKDKTYQTAWIKSFRAVHNSRREAMRDLTPIHRFHDVDTETHTLRVHRAVEDIRQSRALEFNGCQEHLEHGHLHDQGLAPGIIRWDIMHTWWRWVELAAMSHDWGKVECWKGDEAPPWFPKHEQKSYEILTDPSKLSLSAHHPIAMVVRYHGWLMNAEQAGTKARNKLRKALSIDDNVECLGTMRTSNIAERGIRATNSPLNKWEVMFMLVTLCVCDSEGFSDEGRVEARKQINHLIDVLSTDIEPVGRESADDNHNDNVKRRFGWHAHVSQFYDYLDDLREQRAGQPEGYSLNVANSGFTFGELNQSTNLSSFLGI